MSERKKLVINSSVLDKLVKFPKKEHKKICLDALNKLSEIEKCRIIDRADLVSNNETMAMLAEIAKNIVQNYYKKSEKGILEVAQEFAAVFHVDNITSYIPRVIVEKISDNNPSDDFHESHELLSKIQNALKECFDFKEGGSSQKEYSLICDKCKTGNLSESVYCRFCSEPLDKQINENPFLEEENESVVGKLCLNDSCDRFLILKTNSDNEDKYCICCGLPIFILCIEPVVSDSSFSAKKVVSDIVSSLTKTII